MKMDSYLPYRQSSAFSAAQSFAIINKIFKQELPALDMYSVSKLHFVNIRH